MGDVLSFRPTNEEKTLLDKKNIRWTDFCRKNIMDLKIHTKEDLVDKVIIRVSCILLGCLIFVMSFTLLNDVILVIVNYIIAASMVIVGTAGIIFLRRDKKRQTI